MVTISFHQVAIATLSAALACGLVAFFTDDFFITFDVYGFKVNPRFYPGFCKGVHNGLFQTKVTIVKVLLIAGLCFVACCLLLEIISVAVHAARENSTIKAACMLCCLVASILLVIGLAFATPSSMRQGESASSVARGISFLMAAISSVFTLESLVFYLIQWRCQ